MGLMQRITARYTSTAARKFPIGLAGGQELFSPRREEGTDQHGQMQLAMCSPAQYSAVRAKNTRESPRGCL